MTRRFFFQIHWFLGITAGIVLALMGVTGAAMSFEDEISEALSPRIYAPGVPAGADLTPDRLIATLEADNPGYYVARLDWELARERSHRVRMSASEGRGRKQGRVDRATGAILGDSSAAGFFHTMDDLHRWLALPGGGNGIGRQITAFSAIALIFFALSGLYLRWPRKALDWRSWFVLDLRKTGRNLWRALHVTIGTWVLCFYLISALTGLWWSYDWYRQGVIYALTGKAGGEGEGRRKRGDKPVPRPAIDPSWTAFMRDNGQDYVWVRLTRPAPTTPIKTISFDARPQGARHLRQTDKFSYDPKTAALKKSDLYDRRPLGQIITQSMFEIHRGAFFGLPGRLIMLLTSLTMPLFTITGFMLYLSRRKRKQEAKALASAGTEPGEGDAGFLVVYASQTGNAELSARAAGRALAAGGVATQVVALAALTPELLKHANKALFVVSTYGEGDPPDTARGFARRVMRKRLPLAHIDFGVFALGDRQYPDFCAFGKQVDAWLAESGAQRLFPLIMQDGSDNKAFAAWRRELTRLGAADRVAEPAQAAFRACTLVSRTTLNPGSSHAAAFSLRLEPVEGEALVWEAGDIVEIQPRNAPADVDALLMQAAPDGELLEDVSALREQLAAAVLPEDGRFTRDATLRPIGTREYSAASIAADGGIDLVVRQVRRDDGRLGIGSGWLTAHVAEGETVMLRLRPNPGFRTVGFGGRLILIGNGTGIAGLRAHLRAQAHVGRSGHWLLFGERERAHAFFDAELQAWLGDGTLARLDRAFSREADCGRYVQHLLLEARGELLRWIDDGAAILVCGSLEGMAQEVHAALGEIIGEDRLEALIESGRYKRDVY